MNPVLSVTGSAVLCETDSLNLQKCLERTFRSNAVKMICICPSLAFQEQIGIGCMAAKGIVEVRLHAGPHDSRERDTLSSLCSGSCTRCTDWLGEKLSPGSRQYPFLKDLQGIGNGRAAFAEADGFISEKEEGTIDREKEAEIQESALSLAQIIKIPGAKEVMLCFFCYCAIEQTAGLWASSYLHLFKGIPAETAARFAGMFFIGITVGRAVSGFITMKLNDVQMIRLGQVIIFAGILVMLLPGPNVTALAGLILIGLGCAPVYPCIIHSTPEHFGADRSQAIIGVQMASAYVGTCLMPPLFGLIANHISITLFPVYMMALLVLMAVMHELLTKKTAH